MSSIDQRVVQMEFDNKQFEKGIQTTLKSLEELQKGLDLKGATDGIKNIEKSVNNMDVSGIQKTVESIAGHFTWLGRTVDRIIDNLTTRIISLGSNFVESMSINQVYAGWDKYGEKVKSVATIMNATGLTVDQVNQSLEKLNWFTDETSYNFTDMVNNIGKFTAVDVPLEDAVTAMQGIANAAALSGQGVNEASRAMYNFSQAMGTGALLLQDWKSIELANMATTEFKNQLIQSGLAVGTLVKEGDKFVTTTKNGTGSILSFTSASEGFRDSLSARWINTEVMMDTFKKYGEYADEIYKITQREGITAAQAMERMGKSEMDLGERAFKAAQEYRTFTDAIEATKDAVSTGWMQSFEIIFGNYEKAKSIWTSLGNTLWDIFASGTEARNQMLEDVFENQGATLGRKDWLNLVKQGIADEAFEKALTDAARVHGVAIDEMIEKNGSFYDSLKENWLTADILSEALDTTKKSADGLTDGVQNTTERLKELEGVAKRVIQGDFGNGEDRVKALTEAGYDYAEVQGLVNKILKGGEVTLEDLSDAELKQIGYTQEEIDQLNKLKKQAEETGTPLNELIERMTKPTGRDLMIQSASNAFEALMRVIRAVKYAWKDIFPPMTSDRLYSVLEGIRDFTANLILSSDNAQRFRRIFRGVFSIFDVFGQVISAVAKMFGSVGQMFLPIGESILEGAAKIGDSIRAFSSGLRESKVLDTIVRNVTKTVTVFSSKVRSVIQAIKETFDFGSIFDPFKKIWSNFGKWIDSKGGISWIITRFFNRIQNFIRQINANKIASAVQKFVNKIRKAFDGIKSVKDFIEKPFEMLVSFIKSIGTKVSGSLDETDKTFTDRLADVIGAPFDLISKLGTKVSPILSKFGGIVKSGFSALGRALEWNVDFLGKIADKITPLLRTFSLVSTIGSIDYAIIRIANTTKSLRDLTKAVKNYASGKKWDDVGSGIIKIAGAIAILVGSVFVMQKMIQNDPKALGAAMGAIAVLFVELAAGLWLFNKALGTDAEGKTKKISGFLALALGIMVFVNVMQKLLGMKISDIAVALTELIVILGILAIFTNVASGSFKATTGAGLLLTALALQGFLLAMIELANMKPETAAKGLIGLRFLLLEMAAFVRIAGGNFKFTNGAALILTALALQGFIQAVYDIGSMDPEKAVVGILGLGVLLAQIALFLKLAENNIKISQAVSLIAVGGSLLVFTQVIEKIGNIKFGTLVKGLIGMGLMFAEIGYLMKSTQGMTLGGGLGFAVIMASLLTLVPIFNLLAKIPNVEKVGISFGAAVLGIGVAIKALSGTGFAGGLSAGAGLASFTLIVGAIIAVVETIAGLLAKIDGIEGFLSGATGVLTQVGEAIGGFIGGIGGGILSGVSSGLTDLGTGLSEFWTNASGFVEGVKSITPETVEGIGNLAAAILKLTAGELLDALTGWISGGEASLSTFGMELAKAAPWIAIFANIVGSVDKDKMQTAVDALTALVGIDIPRSGGWLQSVIGEKDFGTFGTKLAEMAPGLAEFSSKAANVDAASCKNAAEALSALAGVDIDLTGGWLQDIIGEKDYKGFGKSLKQLGTGLKNFDEATVGVDAASCKNAAEALSALAGVDIDLTGGWLQNIIGEKDYAGFGKNLKQLGSGLAEFVKGTTGITEDQVASIPNLANALSTLSGLDIEKTNGFINAFKGVKNLEQFGTQLGSLGAGLSTFADSTKNVDTEKLAPVISQLVRLSAFANTISGTVVDDVLNFSEAMTTLGGIDLSPILTAFENSYDDFTAAGQTLSTYLINGLSQALYNATSPANSMNVVLNSINGMRSKFKTSGQSLAAGIVEGMKSKVNDVTNAAKMLAHAANQAFRNASDINSPSRVMMKNGAYWVEGFVRGLQNGTNSAEEAAANIGVVSADALQSAMAMVSAMMNSEGDLSPTIRPVLDLSAVQSGAGQISSIFGQSQTIGLGGFQNPFIPKTLDTISSQMNPLGGETVTTDNDDVVMAIQTLGDQFETLKEAVASMKLVMETGAVVGQIKYEIDRQLGRMAELKERGI